jgi:hypothetical protein
MPRRFIGDHCAACPSFAEQLGDRGERVRVNAPRRTANLRR